MKTTRQEVEFDPKALVERVKAFAKHAKAGKAMPRVRITQMAVPPKLKPLPPADIKRIRTRLGVSQAAFAALSTSPATPPSPGKTVFANPAEPPSSS